MIDYLEIDPRIKIRSPHDLLRCDRVVYVNAFNDQAVRQFRDEFMDAHETGQDIIPVVIDSPGGFIHSAFAMYDMIKASDKKVATIAVGKAMSAGAFLLTCGDEGYRYAYPTSSIMIHDVSFGTHGKIEDIKTDSKEGDRINNLLFSIMEKNCGLKKGDLLSKVRKEYNSSDWFITPQQAKKLNIVNHVKVPKLITKVKVETVLL